MTGKLVPTCRDTGNHYMHASGYRFCSVCGWEPPELVRLRAENARLREAMAAGVKALTEDGWIPGHWPLKEMRDALAGKEG